MNWVATISKVLLRKKKMQNSIYSMLEILFKKRYMKIYTYMYSYI